MTEPNVTEISNISFESKQLHFPITTRPLQWGVALTILISIFLRINTILNLANSLYDAKVHSILLYSIVFAVQFLMGFILVVIFLPRLMSSDDLFHSLRVRIRPTRILVITGVLSGGLFLLVATGLSSALGIFHLDWFLLFGKPDVYAEPDVVGWFYFILALVPAIWEEVVFRGIILFQLRNKYSDRSAILLSSLFFSLYHFSVIFSKPIDTVIGGVIMSFFYGLVWGSLVLKSNSILPTMISHYIIDTFGILFLNAQGSDPVVLAQFMIMVTLLYPIAHWIVFRYFKRENEV